MNSIAAALLACGLAAHGPVPSAVDELRAITAYTNHQGVQPRTFPCGEDGENTCFVAISSDGTIAMADVKSGLAFADNGETGTPQDMWLFDPRDASWYQDGGKGEPLNAHGEQNEQAFQAVYASDLHFLRCFMAKTGVILQK